MQKFEMKFSGPVSLEKTMDIQIPALEWLKEANGKYSKFILNTNVTVSQKNSQTLAFVWDGKRQNRDIELRIKDAFPFLLKDIDVGDNEALKLLQAHYGEIAYMRTDPFRALITTILSQNRTGEITRKVFHKLSVHLKGISAKKIIEMPEEELKEIIRSSGPYKANFMQESCKMITKDFSGDLERLVTLDTNEALRELTKLKGVSHKTAACILVYSDMKRDVTPVDTHLGRVVSRIGLVSIKNKSMTRLTQEDISTQLSRIIPDLGYAHLFFVMLGREVCFSKSPECVKCPVAKVCSFRI